MAERLAVAGLFVFALFGLLGGTAPANWGLALLALATLAVGRAFWHWFREDTAAWLAAAFLGYVLFRGTLLPNAVAVPADSYWQTFIDWAFLGVVPVLAYWVRGREDRFAALMMAALVGFLLGRIRELDAQTIADLINIRRNKFGIKALAIPLYAAIGLLGVGVYHRRWSAWLRARCNRAGIVAGYVVAAMVVVALLMLIVSSLARGTWLAATITFPVVAIGLLWPAFRRGARRHLKPVLAGVVGAAVVVAVLAAVAGDRIYNRVTTESDTWSAVAEGDWESVPYTSIGRRVHMIRAGLGWVGEAPVFGKGVASVEHMLAGMGELSKHDDLHMSVLDTAVELGLVGLALLLGIIAYSYLRLVKAFRDGTVSTDTFWFLTGAAMLFFGVAMTNNRLQSYDGQFAWLLLMSGILGLGGLATSRRRQAAVSPERAESQP